MSLLLPGPLLSGLLACLIPVTDPSAGIVSIRKELFADIVAIEAPDPATLILRIKEPDASFLATLALPNICIYSAAKLAEDPNFPARTMLGSRPFVFVDHRDGSHWIGKRSPLALSNEELSTLPGYGRDAEKSRARAKELLVEAGAGNLKLKLINRNIDHPFTPLGVFVIDQWRRIGVTAEHTQLDVSQQKATIANGDFTVALDAFCADGDDPKPPLLPYLSKSRSPRNMTRSETPEFDILYDTFKSATDEAQRKRVAAAMQRMVIEAANSVPALWYSRIVAHVSTMKGWKIIPTHFANQDLADVWLDQ